MALKLADIGGSQDGIGAVEDFIREGRFRYVRHTIEATGRVRGTSWVDWITQPAVDAAIDSSVFLEAVESLGACHVLDRRSVTDAIHWLSAHPEQERLSLRISGSSLEHADLAKDFIESMQRRDVDPRRVCFDIAVHSALFDLGGATRFVKAMRREGSLVTLCDAIPGNPVLGLYGPLGLVNHLRVHRRWVQQAPDCRSHRETLESIVDYAKRLGLIVIADGVDTQAQYEIVSCMGVDFYGGEHASAKAEVAESERIGGPLTERGYASG